MLLFLTREAFCRRSIDDRRVGDGDPERPLSGMFSELKLRFCQNKRGDVVPSSGEDWNGDESVFRFIFCYVFVSDDSSSSMKSSTVVGMSYPGRLVPAGRVAALFHR